nr:50S ribosomal protein L30 [Metallosphaera hakonensis]
MSSIVVIRLRGSASTPWEIQETLEMLRLKRNYNAMIYPKDDNIVGMVRKVQSYVTWGELNLEGIKAIISKIRTAEGPLNEEITKKYFGMSMEDLISKIVQGQIRINQSPMLKLPIRLHPPRKGFKGKINSFLGAGGELGYRAEKNK